METKTIIMAIMAAAIIVVAVVVSALITAIAVPAMIGANTQATSAMSATLPKNATVTLQGTGISTMDTLPSHEHHQAVVVLPVRTDGKIWVGTISWTASKPVEVRLLYDYNSTVPPDVDIKDFSVREIQAPQ
jgi:hypothetical protein